MFFVEQVGFESSFVLFEIEDSSNKSVDHYFITSESAQEEVSLLQKSLLQRSEINDICLLFYFAAQYI